MISFLKHITQGFRGKLTLIILIRVVQVTLSLLFVWFSKKAIDLATGVTDGTLWRTGTLLIAITLVQIVLRTYDVRLRNMTEVRMSNRIRRMVYEHLIYTRWETVTDMHSGDLLTRMIRDIDDVVRIPVTALPLIVSALLQFVGALALLITFDPVLALALGVVMPLLAIFSKRYYVRMRHYSHRIKESESHITELMEESLLNQLVIRTFELQEKNLDRLTALQETLQGHVKRRTKVSVFANLTMQLAFTGGYLTAFLWSVYGLAKRTISFGTVTAYIQLVSRIQRPLLDVMRLLPQVIAAKTAVERLEQLTSHELEETGKQVLLTGAVSLCIDHLTFAYDVEAPNVLSDFSLHTRPGDMIAVTGETGAGKTTLLRLLLGLLKPTAGAIRIGDGRQEVAVSEATRSNFVYVPQGHSLFSGTIRENLKIGDEHADDEKLKEVLETASARFVFDLPDGLDTLLGENGSGLSEGQAQRIAIARSLLRPGKILLLDEATSALDAETEKNFLRQLKQRLGNRTVLFITHHREVADFCDNVIKI